MLVANPVENPLAASLAAGQQALGLELSATQQESLLRYVALLEKWNKTYNLTAIREPARMIGLHLLDSLAVVPHLRGRTLLDVGTGPGLPGIPLAVACPELEVTLLDSLQKKIAFVQQAIGELGLTRARAVCQRVESLPATSMWEMVISRAFADLADFVDGAGHLVAPGGRLLAMKGVYPEAEIQRLPAPWVLETAVPLLVPQVDAQRHLLILKRV